MNAARRRRAFLLGLTVLAALLVGGRWLALETAERAWAATIPRGGVYLAARDLARLTRGLVLLVAVSWGTANLYCVYRAIGSVQLPRRLGDLEIVEAVPQPVLLAGTLACGFVYGLLLTLGTGDWWLQALLASRPPVFGIADPVLHRDLGFYFGELPWAVTCKNYALLATTTGALLVALLYLGIGSLRFNGWRPEASAHARAHLGLVLALLALCLVRAAVLDPPEAVAGLHGTFDTHALAARIPGARLIVSLGVVTALATLAWAVRERPRLLIGAWGVLLVASLAVYGVAPGMLRGAATADQTRDRFERLAFGSDWTEREPGSFPTLATALHTIPVWDADRVATVARRTPLWTSRAPDAGTALVAQRAAGTRATWVVVPAPAAGATPGDPGWRERHRGVSARAGRPLAVSETDTGLAVSRLPTRDSAFWFGPGFRDFAVAAPDTWPALGASGVRLKGRWRRTALAWTLQSPELMRAQTDDLVLVWRRDVTDRLDRLAPFAVFHDPTPLIAAQGLWWASYGTLESRVAPLGRPLDLPGGDRSVRYYRTAVLGVVNAATGDTRLYLTPGADSLAAAWARLLAPLIRPSDSIPAELRERLPYPHDALRVAAQHVLRTRGDSSPWRAWPRLPYELAAPADSSGAIRLWTVQAFDSGSPSRFTGLLAGTLSPAGPRLDLWTPAATLRLPRELYGSPETAPGAMRLWSADGALLTLQGLFAEAAADRIPTGVSKVYVTWGERESEGPTPAAALRTLLASGARDGSTDTTLAARWEFARHLTAQADSAAAAGDLEAFGRLFGQLKKLLGVRAKPAPRPERR